MEHNHFEAKYPSGVREQEMKALSGYIIKGKSAQVISIPGVGRSVLLGLLAYNKKLRLKYFGKDIENLHFVHVDFSEIRNRPLIEAIKVIFLSLAHSLREWHMHSIYTKINWFLKNSLSYKDDLALFQALKESIEFLCLEKNIKVVFLFDKFEEYISSVDKQFFTNLKILRSHAKYNFVVIFSLNRPLENLIGLDTISEYSEFVVGNQLYISRFDQEITDFRVKYIEKIIGETLETGLLESVIKETGGVGKLIKIAVELLLSSENKKNHNLGNYLISNKAINVALSEICRSLLPSEQIALINADYSDIDVKNYLESVGILAGNKIQIPLFEKHIEIHRGEKSGSDDLIKYDSYTRRITKGDIVLSNSLTNSEYKLLLALLQAGDRIISRDEIISSTWSDIKSTAGITDQAVDQLIFRLRRKIEVNSNNPKHLLTVKGRGFRFVA